MLVDSRLGFKEIDIKILENLSDINIQTCIVFTKIDKLKTKKEKEKIKSYIDKVQNQHYKKIFNTSIHQSNGRSTRSPHHRQQWLMAQEYRRCADRSHRKKS